MLNIKSNLIRSLNLAENQFLQVLVEKWRLEHSEAGIALDVRFGENTPAINTRQAKYLMLSAMGSYYREKLAEYQTAIDSFMNKTRDGVFSYDDERFPFRYASGGTLPVVSMGNRSYYCLFYRDIFPIGWNIANGGCETRGELHNPFRTIERELCEELLVINPEHRTRYIFERNKNKLVDGLEYEVADDLWEKHAAKLDIRNYAELMLPMKWIEGPDTVRVKYEGSKEFVTRGYFLNINAEDFGIEVDKISHINLHRDDILMSGEVLGGHQVNTPIGLFAVERFDSEVPDDKTDLLPDKFYFNAIACDGDRFTEIFEKEFVPYISKYRTDAEHSQWSDTEKRFNLCPVTRQILRRYLQFKKNGTKSADDSFDFFISFGEEDRDLAREVASLLAKKKKSVFMRPQSTSHEDWENIDRALDSAQYLIAVGRSRKALTHHYPSYEYRSFYRDIMFGKKGMGNRLVSLISGMRQEDLPPPLCHLVVYGAKGFESGIAALSAYVERI